MRRGDASAAILVKGCAKVLSRNGTRTIVAATLAMLIVLLCSAVVPAQSPLVAELQSVATSYHNDPTRLDAIRNGLEQTIKTDSRVENLVALARVSFIWGDIRATTDDQKVEAYDRGRQVAKRVIELDPRNVEGHFWYALNTA